MSRFDGKRVEKLLKRTPLPVCLKGVSVPNRACSVVCLKVPNPPLGACLKTVLRLLRLRLLHPLLPLLLLLLDRGAKNPALG